MSTKLTTWVWHGERTAELRGNAFVALLALADVANDDGHVIYATGAKKTQEGLAKKSRMAVATFRRMTNELVALGLLEVTRESQRSENEYRVLMTAQSERSGLSGQTVPDERSERSPGERSSAVTPLMGHIDISDVGGAPHSRGTRIPDPFVVTTEMWSWASESCPLVDGRRSTEMFVNYWRAKTGKDATKKDWPATWRNWLLRDQADAERRAPGARTFAQQKQEGNLAILARYQDEGMSNEEIRGGDAAGVRGITAGS